MISIERSTPECSNEMLVGSKRQQRDIACALQCLHKLALMGRANSGNPTWQNLSTLRNKLKEEASILVVDVVNLVHAEFADLLTPHKLPFGSAGCCGFSHESHV